MEVSPAAACWSVDCRVAWGCADQSPNGFAGRTERTVAPFCQKHRIRRMEVLRFAARGETQPGSDIDLLVTLDESLPVSTAELLEMAGEAEELVGRPVDFVLRPSIEKSPNRFTREHILSTAVCVYGG